MADRVRTTMICFALALGLVGLSGCSDDDTGNSGCTNDADCDRGTVCDGSACVQRDCSTQAECGQNRGCIQDTGTCTGRECLSDADCTSNPDFGAGYTCVALACTQGAGPAACTSRDDCAATNQICNPLTQQCVAPPSQCSADDHCPSPEVCDLTTSACVAPATTCTSDDACADDQYCDLDTGACAIGCREGACDVGFCDLDTRACDPEGGCTVSECAATDQACDPDTGACVDRAGASACAACTPGSSDECGAAGIDRCSSFGGGSFCTPQCEQPGDCPTGFTCQQITNNYMGCVPLGNACEGCLVDGCAAGQFCNPGTKVCDTATPTCDPCTNPLECGPGADCVDYQNRDRCLSECGVDGACAADFTCNATNGLCEPTSGACSSCDLIPADCTAPNAILDEASCDCVGCLSNTDCPAGQLCNAALQCEVNCNCTAPLVCDPTTGACSDPGGNGCTDQQCAAQLGEGGMCDPVSGLCYVAGACDPADPNLAPCPMGCDASFGFCNCDPNTQQGCRDGETCGFGQIFPLPYCIGGGFGFP